MSHPERALPDSVERALKALSENPEESSCPHCGGELRYFKTRFWIEGTDKAWNIRVPVCLDCES
jgi:uncharacterized protein with PIN domain